MGKLKYRILSIFKKKYFVALIIIFALIFAETSYKFIVRLGSNLVEAEGVPGKQGIPIVEMEMYENYGKNRRLFNEKVEAFRRNLILKDEEALDKEIVEEVKEVEQEENIISDMEDEMENTDIAEKEIQEDKKEETSEDLEQEETVTEEEIKEKTKIAYLTFDDGPSSTVTPQILDILAQYDIKATFFVVGKYAERNPDILKRIYDEGHVIGNHSYSHNYNYIYKNVSNFIKELDITNQVFKNILGEEFETDLMRFPGGSFEDWKSSFRKLVTDLGYRFVDWNSLNGDAEGHNLSKDKLFERFKSTYRNQNELIILMHDTDAKVTTAEALPAIIEFLIEEGYDFGTL